MTIRAILWAGGLAAALGLATPIPTHAQAQPTNPAGTASSPVGNGVTVPNSGASGATDQAGQRTNRPANENNPQPPTGGIIGAQRGSGSTDRKSGGTTTNSTSGTGTARQSSSAASSTDQNAVGRQDPPAATPAAVGTSGQAQRVPALQRLPDTASALPEAALLGCALLVCACGLYLLRLRVGA